MKILFLAGLALSALSSLVKADDNLVGDCKNIYEYIDGLKVENINEHISLTLDISSCKTDNDGNVIEL